jgi:fatty acid kinase fatty acid binding subunit
MATLLPYIVRFSLGVERAFPAAPERQASPDGFHPRCLLGGHSGPAALLLYNAPNPDGHSGNEANMIEIITDSTCDIPESLLEKHRIIVVPLAVIWGNKQYRDRLDLKPEEFYRRLTVDPERPTTSIPPVKDFEAAYGEALARGADGVVVVTISSAMSGVYQLAESTAPRDKLPVSVIDAKGPTMSLGWQVLAAARARDAGASLPEIVAQVEGVRSRLAQMVFMDTLDYLRHGGRIGEAMKWMGVRLQVKPLVLVNHRTGRVEPVGLARTYKAGVEMLYSKFFGLLGGLRNLRVAVLHGNAADEAQALAERIRAEIKPVELLVNMTGPVLGVNTGPGALALCGYGEG